MKVHDVPSLLWLVFLPGHLHFAGAQSSGLVGGRIFPRDVSFLVWTVDWVKVKGRCWPVLAQRSDGDQSQGGMLGAPQPLSTSLTSCPHPHRRKSSVSHPFAFQPQGEGALDFYLQSLWILIHQTLEFGKKKGRTRVPKASEAPRHLSFSSPQGAFGAHPPFTSGHMHITVLSMLSEFCRQ